MQRSLWSRTTAIRTEARAMALLAIPVVLDHLGSMSMPFVDTIMVGRLGPEELGAVGAAAAVYSVYMVFANGIISSVSPTVAHAFGAREDEEIGRAAGQGFWLVLGLALLGWIVTWNMEGLMSLTGQDPEVASLAGQYIRALSAGIPASLSYFHLRSFAVGLGQTRITMVISFIGAAVNIPLVYLLIFGGGGIPPLGVTGAGLATAAVHWVMLLTMSAWVRRHREFRAYHLLAHALRPEPAFLKRLIRLGLPIGAGMSMENGFFALTNTLMGRFSTVALASHQIAINVAAIAFMVPLGISVATTTRVGHAMGRREPELAALAGWTGIVMGGMVMSVTALTFILFSRPIISIYTADPETAAYARGLLAIAGAFQICDGLQVTALGALRGLKDTTVPMFTNLLSYWLCGLPVGLWLGFTMELEGEGLWWGLTAGLTVAAVAHGLRFRGLTQRLREQKEMEDKWNEEPTVKSFPPH